MVQIFGTLKNFDVKTAQRYKTFGFGLFAVCIKENDQMIGDCDLTT